VRRPAGGAQIAAHRHQCAGRAGREEIRGDQVGGESLPEAPGVHRRPWWQPRRPAAGVGAQGGYVPGPPGGGGEVGAVVRIAAAGHVARGDKGRQHRRVERAARRVPGGDQVVEQDDGLRRDRDGRAARSVQPAHVAVAPEAAPQGVETAELGFGRGQMARVAPHDDDRRGRPHGGEGGPA
jgi:hypothetical protein